MFAIKSVVMSGVIGVAGFATTVQAQTAQSPQTSSHQSHSSTLPNTHSGLKLDGHRTLGAPHSFRNLTIIPVYDSRATSHSNVITLDEGLKKGLVKVTESKDGGDVNTLYVTNLSNKPLYLMAGEVVLGGQQDRAVGQDMLVSAGKRHLPITVFCVEHGRWTGEPQFNTSALAVASAGIRSDAQNGAFARAAPATLASAAPIGASGAAGFWPGG